MSERGDFRTQAIVLRRVNYGEADRIITFLTPEGELAVLARGVRKERSKLAGSVELFCRTEITYHRGKTALATLTSARVMKFYGKILADLGRMELAAEAMRKLARAAEAADNPEYFRLLAQVLAGLDGGVERSVVAGWFELNLAQASGTQFNLMRDAQGAELRPEQRYHWDYGERALRADAAGPITAREIKLARLALASPLATIARVEGAGEMLERLRALAR